MSLPHSFFSNWHNKDENLFLNPKKCFPRKLPTGFHKNLQLPSIFNLRDCNVEKYITQCWSRLRNKNNSFWINIHWFKYFFSDARAHFKLWTKIILKFWNDKLNNKSYTLDWSMRATGVSRHSPLSQVVGSLIYNLRWEKKNQLLIKFKLSLVKIAILIYRVYILGTVH